MHLHIDPSVKRTYKSFRKKSKTIDNIEIIERKREQELFSVYRSIGRHFLKTVLVQHRKCISYFGQTLFWDKYTVSCQERICEFANSFILWRMYFEGLGHPIQLFKKVKRTLHNIDSKGFESKYSDESFESIKRIFALECYWVFYECQVLANVYHLDDAYSFAVIDIEKKLTPHWIVEVTSQTKEADVFRLYYWIENNEFLKFIREKNGNFKCNSLQYGPPIGFNPGAKIIREKLEAIRESSKNLC